MTPMDRPLHQEGPSSPRSGPDPLLAVRALLLGERLDSHRLADDAARTEGWDCVAAVPLTLRLADGGMVVCFRYGAVVLFGISAEAEGALLRRLGAFVGGPVGTGEVDDARVRIDDQAEETVDSAGLIWIRQASGERLQLIADVLAKSLVLAHYESGIADIFDRIEPVAATLRERGRGGAGGTDLLRQIGHVLLIQHKMVGRVETGEKPDLLWDHPELERLHLRLSEEYELRERSRALDRKLDVIARTMETLLGLVHNRSSLRVEWYILALIVAELVASLYPLFVAR